MGFLEESDEPIGTEKYVSLKSSKPTAIVLISLQISEASPKVVKSDRHFMITSTFFPRPFRSKNSSTRCRKHRPKQSVPTYSYDINSHRALQKILNK